MIREGVGEMQCLFVSLGVDFTLDRQGRWGMLDIWELVIMKVKESTKL